MMKKEEFVKSEENFHPSLGNSAFYISDTDDSSSKCSISGDDQVGYQYDCSNRGFNSVPTDFHANTTRISLDHNNIKDVKETAFCNYSRLITLDLSDNPLALDNKELDKIFAPLVSLQQLFMSSITKTDNFTKLTSAICKNLHGLTHIYMDIVDNFNFSEDCKKLIYLKHLRLYFAEPVRLQNTSLQVLESLPIEEIMINGQKIKRPLEADFLRPLRHLRTLEIDSGTAISYLLETILYPLQNRTNPIDINFAKKYLLVYGYQIEKLSTLHLKYIKNICVRKLNLRDTLILSIAYRTLIPSNLWNCLEEFDVSYNYDLVSWDTYIFSISAPKIQVINMCCQLTRQNKVPKTFKSINSNNEIQNKHDNNFAEIHWYFPDQLKSMSFSDNDFQSNYLNFDLVVHAKGIKEFFLRDLFFKDCLGKLKGLQNLQVLQITRWDCSHINPNFIANLTSVTELTFTGVNLGENAKTMTFFTNWVHLEFLDISQNLITDLHPEFLKYQRNSLRTLTLSTNLLRSIPSTVMSLRAIERIDLRHNLIAELKTEEMAFIDQNKQLRIMLSDNALRCTCTSLTFQFWLKKNSHKINDYDTLTCIDENDIKRNLSEQIRSIKKKQLKCVSQNVLYFAIFGNIVLLLCIFVALLLVKFQADVFYIIARIRRYFIPQKSWICDNTFHAFVSYGNSNYQWAVHELRVHLEREGFRLLLPDLDFDLLKDHADNIIDAIDNSRRVIFVITRDFLSDDWCDYGVQMAKSHAFRNPNQNFIIVILRDAIPLHEIPKSLKKIWIRVNCIRWPMDEDKEAVREFWKKLNDALRED